MLIGDRNPMACPIHVSRYAVPQSPDRPGKVGPLAANWHQAADAKGAVFYYNSITQETTRTRPKAMGDVKHVPAAGVARDMYTNESAGPIYAPPPGYGPGPTYATLPAEDHNAAVYVAPMTSNPDYAPALAPRTAPRTGNVVVGYSAAEAVVVGSAGGSDYLTPQGQGYCKPQTVPPPVLQTVAAPAAHVYEYHDQLPAGSAGAGLHVRPNANFDGNLNPEAMRLVHPDPQYDLGLLGRAAGDVGGEQTYSVPMDDVGLLGRVAGDGGGEQSYSVPMAHNPEYSAGAAVHEGLEANLAYQAASEVGSDTARGYALFNSIEATP